MLKTSESTESKTRPGKGGVGVGGSRAGRERRKLDGSELHVGDIDGGKVEDDEVEKKVQKCKNLFKFKKVIGLDFFTPGARLAFTELRQAFVKAPILHHFDPERHIWIEMDVSSYVIGRVLNQLTSDNLGWWHSVAFFFQKMILAGTRYETHDGELWAIVEAVMTWKHYLEGFQHEVLMLTDHNNLWQFLDTKYLSSKQVRWAQQLFCYHFQIDYRQDKAHKAADALFWYPQQSAEEEEAIRAENVKIFYHLQLSLAEVFGLWISQLSPLHQILICEMTIFSWLNQFWNSLQGEKTLDNPYIANIGGMRLQLSELQENNEETKLLRGSADLPEGWEDVDGVF